MDNQLDVNKPVPTNKELMDSMKQIQTSLILQKLMLEKLNSRLDKLDEAVFGLFEEVIFSVPEMNAKLDMLTEHKKTPPNIDRLKGAYRYSWQELKYLLVSSKGDD